MRENHRQHEEIQQNKHSGQQKVSGWKPTFWQEKPEEPGPK